MAETASAISISAGRPLGFGPGFVHRQMTSIQGRAIESFDGGLRLFCRAHGHEAETAGTPGDAVGHEVGFDDGSVRGESILQVIFGGIKREVTYEYFCVHVILSRP